MENTNEQAMISIEKGSVGRRLKKARVMLQNMNLKKSGYNPRFSYYELSDFMPHVNNIFDQLDLLGVFVMDSEKATLTIFDADNLDEKIVFSMPVREAKIPGNTEMQCLGGTQTYLRRYLHLSALEITESDLLDAQVGGPHDELTIDIEKIQTLNDLNRVYILLQKNNRKNSESLKEQFRKKAKFLGACLDKNSNTFVAAQKNTAVAAMI
jgi:hypothetical protein